MKIPKMRMQVLVTRYFLKKANKKFIKSKKTIAKTRPREPKNISLKIREGTE